MKKLLILVFMIGMFTLSCSSPPDYALKPNVTKSDYVMAADLQTGNQISATVMNAQDVTVLPVPDTPVPAKKNWILENWAALVLGIMGFAKIVVNLTPTQADNAIFGLLDNFINMLIPNLKKGGGKFT